MMDFFTNSLNGILVYFQKQRIEKERNYKEALLAILEALTETQTYLEDGKSTERDRAIELRLSRLWDTAAIKVKEFEPALASELKHKGLYWLDHLDLSRRELYQSRITLRQVRQKYEKLYSGK